MPSDTHAATGGYCTACGSAVPAGDRFCEACGAPRPVTPSPGPTATGPPATPAPPPVAAPPPDDARQWRWIAAAASAVAVVAVVVAVAVSTGGDHQADVTTTTDVPTTETVPTTDTTAGTDTTLESPTTETTATPAPTVPDTLPPPVGTSPVDAVALYLDELAAPLPFAGDCDTVGPELAGEVLCTRLMEDRGATQVHLWGVAATDVIGGWLLLGQEGAGWVVVDATFDEVQPGW